MGNEFNASPDFIASDGKQPGTLVVTVVENVGWKEKGKRTKVYYTVAFTAVDDKELGTTKGSCWNDDFERCGAQIVKRAKPIARKVKLKH